MSKSEQDVLSTVNKLQWCAAVQDIGWGTASLICDESTTLVCSSFPQA